MNHIFFINSNITELVAYYVINYLQLDADEVVLVPTRNKRLTVLDRFNCIRIKPKYFESLRGNGIRRMWDLWKIAPPRLHDRIFSSPYHAYVPQSRYPFVASIIRSSYCTGFSYLEEGDGAYTTRVRWSDPLPSIFRKHLFSGGFDHVYGISDQVYQSVEPNRRVILTPFRIPEAKSSNAVHDGTKVLCMPGGTYSPATYPLEVISSLISPKEKCFLQLHPGLGKKRDVRVKIVNAFNRIFERGMLLPRNINLEHEMLSSRLDLYGGPSSLQRYAEQFGSEYHAVWLDQSRLVPLAQKRRP